MDRTTKLAVTCLAVLIVAALVFVSWVRSKYGDPPEPPEDRRPAAYRAAKGLIERRLKAPSTATFAPFDETNVQCDGTMCTVSGTVDSQNSFGTMLRSRYACTLEDQGDRWTGNCRVLP